jgi:hypothetical protein
MLKPMVTRLSHPGLGSRPLAAAALAAALVVGAAPAHATVMVPMTLDELTADAVLVVRGRVVGRDAAWDRAHERIYTTARLVVTETVLDRRQADDREILVRSLGGEVGEVGMKVAGSPQLGIGEDVLLFLRVDPAEPSTFAVVGMNQGRFDVRAGADGQLVARATLEGIALAQRGGDGVLRVAGRDADPRAWPYAELKARVRAASSAPGTPAVGAPAQAPAQSPKAPPAVAPSR